MAVANGALLEVPVFETNHRGKNWMAIIDIDGTCPGGLSRRFIDRGRGECYYLIEQVALFDPVEFGADYVTTTGKKYNKRWFGVVTAKTEDYLLVEQCASGKNAVLLSKARRIDPKALADALEQERSVMLKKAEELQASIDALRSGDAKPEDIVIDPTELDPPAPS